MRHADDGQGLAAMLESGEICARLARRATGPAEGVAPDRIDIIAEVALGTEPAAEACSRALVPVLVGGTPTPPPGEPVLSCGGLPHAVAANPADE